MDDTKTILAEQPFAWEVFKEYQFKLTVDGETITGTVGDITLTATDSGTRLRDGSAGFMIEVGTITSESLSVVPVA